MSFAALLNQTIEIHTQSGKDRYGKPAFDVVTEVSGRFEKTKKTMVNAQKETEPIQAIVFLPGTTSIDTGDKVIFSGTSYRAMIVSPIIDGRGTTRHIEVMLQLWAN